MIVYLTHEQRRALLKALKRECIFAPPGVFDGTFTVENTGLIFKVQTPEETKEFHEAQR